MPYIKIYNVIFTVCVFLTRYLIHFNLCLFTYDNNIKNHSFSEFVHALGEPGEDDEADDDDEEKDEILPLP